MGLRFMDPAGLPMLDQELRELIPKPEIEGLAPAWPTVRIAHLDDDYEESHLGLDGRDAWFLDIEVAGQDFQAARLQVVAFYLLHELDQIFIPERLKDWMSRFMATSTDLTAQAETTWGNSGLRVAANICGITVAPLFREEAFLTYLLKIAQLAVAMLERRSPFSVRMTFQSCAIDSEGELCGFSSMQEEWFEGSILRLGAKPAPPVDHHFDFYLGRSGHSCQNHPAIFLIPNP